MRCREGTQDRHNTMSWPQCPPFVLEKAIRRGLWSDTGTLAGSYRERSLQRVVSGIWYKVKVGKNRNISCQSDRLPQANVHRRLQPYIATTMRPTPRSTRSEASPGVVDLPRSKRSSAVVAQEKSKKQEAARLKAEEARRRAAEVAKVEREVRKAQAEAQVDARAEPQAVKKGARGKGKMVRKTFARPVEDAGPSVSFL
jgi:hypothetical protein